jgi:hypothetical protein
MSHLQILEYVGIRVDDQCVDEAQVASSNHKVVTPVHCQLINVEAGLLNQQLTVLGMQVKCFD